MIDSLLGGGGNDDREARRAERQARRSMRHDPELQQQAEQFHARHVSPDPNETNAPGDIWKMFQQVQHDATPDQMQSAVQKTIDSLTPEQRADLGKLLQQGGQTAAGPTAGAAGAGGLLGMLQGAIGTGAPAGAEHGGGILDTIFGHGGHAAAPVPAPSQPAPQPAAKDDESLFPGFLNNPLAKVVLGGIAAYGAKTVADAYKQQGH